MESFYSAIGWLDDKMEYEVYTLIQVLWPLVQKLYFLYSVPLSLNIFNDPPNLEYTLSI